MLMSRVSRFTRFTKKGLQSRSATASLGVNVSCFRALSCSSDVPLPLGGLVWSDLLYLVKRRERASGLRKSTPPTAHF